MQLRSSILVSISVLFGYICLVCQNLCMCTCGSKSMMILGVGKTEATQGGLGITLYTADFQEELSKSIRNMSGV